MTSTKVIVCAAMCVLGSHSQAESLRCNGDIVQVGDSKASVMAKCGEPMLKDSFCKPIDDRDTNTSTDADGVTVNVANCENIDEWTYNPGEGQLLTTLTITQGKVVSIAYGDRVQ